MTNEFDKAGVRNRVTKEEIDNLIERVDYHLFDETTVTACLIWLKNGAKVLGVNYGRILPEEQNWEMGKQEAYKDAYNKIWELEGYVVRQNLHDYVEGKKLLQEGESELTPVAINAGFDDTGVVYDPDGWNKIFQKPGEGN